MTADGEILRTWTPSTHPDLFWAIRGGGGNFGVATRFRFRLHEVGTIVGGMLILPATPEVIAGFIAEARGRAGGALDDRQRDDGAADAVPAAEEAHGKRVVMAMMAYAGDVEDGERAVAPFRALATPLADMLRPMPYPEMYPARGRGLPPDGVGRTMFVDRVDAAPPTTILEHLEASTATMRVAQLRVLGGAMARVPADATAFAHRASRDHGQRRRDLRDTRGAAERTRRGSTASPPRCARATTARTSTSSPTRARQRVRAAYPGATWDRLAAIKARYDPDNLFRLNQNIPPAG